MERSVRPLVDRVREKMAVADPDWCWPWLGARLPAGYGKIGMGKRGTWALAHRVVYELAWGPIPDGLVIDHLCGHPCCVNPLHLDAVPQRINLVRGLTPNMILHEANVCKYGHALTPDNVYVERRGKYTCRRCKICTKERQGLYRQEKQLLAQSRR
jgi:hypothetical protein